MKNLLFLILCLPLVSLSQTPSLSWANHIGGSGATVNDNISPQSMGSDSLGNIFVAGTFEGVSDFEPNTGTFNLYSNGDHDIYIAKYDSIGNFLWVKQIGGSLYDMPTSLNVDYQGNIYLTGNFSDTVDFDPSANVNLLYSEGNSDGFVSKFDNSGNVLWVKKLGGEGEIWPFSIVSDKLGNIFITGGFSNNVDFDPGLAAFNINTGGTDAFILKLNLFGGFEWAKAFESGSFDGASVASSITLDTFGNVYTIGGFSGTVDFDPSGNLFNQYSSGDVDTYISKLDSLGNFIWAKKIGGPDYMESKNIIVCNENIWISGNFIGTVDFDPSSTTYQMTSLNGALDIFIAKLDLNGQLNYAGVIGGSNIDLVRDFVLDKFQNVYITGIYENATDLDPSSSVYNLSGGYRNSFTLKLDSLLNFKWAFHNTGTSSTYSECLSLDSNDCIYIAGYFNGTIDCDPGPGVYNLGPVNGISFDVFFEKVCQENIIGDNNLDVFDKLDVYPNPSTGILFLNGLPLIGIVEMYDINGKCILSKEYETNTLKLNLESLSNGIYSLVVKSKQRILKAQKIAVINEN